MRQIITREYFISDQEFDEDNYDYEFSIYMVDNHLVVYFLSYEYSNRNDSDIFYFKGCCYLEKYNDNVILKINHHFWKLEEEILELENTKYWPGMPTSLFKNVESLLEAFEKKGQTKNWVEFRYWSEFISVLLKGYLGQLESKEDFLSVLEIEEHHIRTEIIQRNGGINSLLSKLETELVEQTENHELYVLSKRKKQWRVVMEKNYLLVEKLPDNYFIVTLIRDDDNKNIPRVLAYWINQEENLELVEAEIEGKNS